MGEEEYSVRQPKLEEQIKYHELRAMRPSLPWAIAGAIRRWLLTSAIVVWFFLALRFYLDQLPIMSSTTEREFNTLVTGLSIALGLSVTLGFSEVISHLRWWILSRNYYSARKIDLIIQADSLQGIIGLATKTRQYAFQAAALLWLALIVLCQIALAAIGLFYSVDRVENYALVITPGNVTIPNMSNIETVKTVQSNSTSIPAQEFTANSYGLMSVAFATAGLDVVPEPGTLWTPADPLMFCRDKMCEYVFHESSARYWDSETTDPLTVLTARRINSSATCQSWTVIEGGQGKGTHITLDTKDGAQVITIPFAGGLDQTTFMTNTSHSCGPGCCIVSAFEASEVSPWYYECEVAVGAGTGGTIPEHQVGDDLRSMASAGIALQGYAASSIVNATSIQHSSYPAESIFGVPRRGDTDLMAYVLARFAIGVLAVTAQNNLPITISGMVPQRGQHLEVDNWGYVGGVLIFLAGLQLILELAAITLARKVVVPPKGSSIAVARLLQPLAVQACSLHDEENKDCVICVHKDRWMYCSRQTSTAGVYKISMEKEEKPRSKEDI